MSFSALLLGLCLSGIQLTGSHLAFAQSDMPAPTRLTVKHDGAMLTVRPTFTLSDTTTTDTTVLRYDLTVERTGASTARSHQGGAFTPTPGRTDTLSTVRLNAQPGDRLTVHLVVRRGERVIAEQTRTEQIGDPE